MSIKDLLLNKDSKEQSRIKSEEISKLKHTGKFKDKDLEVEILSLTKIQVGDQHGIEIMARAWKNGKQLGFMDGSVEIERFRFWNPLFQVFDGIKENLGINQNNGLEMWRHNLKEDPIEATRQDLAHTINVVGKDNGVVVSGKIGNTTSTIYPQVSGGGANTTCDGRNHFGGGSLSWANRIDGAGDYGSPSDTGGSNTGACAPYIIARTTTNLWGGLGRGGFTFLTSVIGTDAISSATFSLYGLDVTSASLTESEFSINIYSWAPTANNTIDGGGADFPTAKYGSTAFSTAIAAPDWGNGAYQDFALNASGIATINKTGVTALGTRESQRDVGATSPTWSSGGSIEFNYYYSDYGSNQPKLVVVHTAAANSNFFMFFPN